MSRQLPSFLEDHISLIPALQLLQNLGWRYVTPEEAVALRGGRLGSVLLESVLVDQLRKLNRIRFKGETCDFSEGNIQAAVQGLKDVMYDGLVRTNEKIYDLLVLGRSLQQTIDGDTKSFPLQYIDWKPETWLTNNVFHVTAEFEVERTASHETRRPDIVLFVNGIPLAVIECKRPDIKGAIAEAISQNLRNQREDEIPKLFLYSQLLLGLSKNEAMYGTTGTAAKFWAVWREEVDKELAPIVNRPLSAEQKDRLFSGCYQFERVYVVREAVATHTGNGDLGQLAADTVARIDDIILHEKIVNWTTNKDVQNRMRNEIEDALHDLKSNTGLALSFDEIDQILEKCLDIARRRYPG